MDIITVSKIELPVNENLVIQKRSIQGNTSPGKRVSIVTGIHGDELEGQYVCFLIAQILENSIEQLSGTVDLYPALNPLGMDTLIRGVPGFDIDMNRIFPGSDCNSMVEKMAHDIITDIEGSDLCIDIHSSNIFLREIPQVRISVDMAETLVPLARQLNINFIWVYENATVLESTLAHSLNKRHVPTLVVEMGVGMRITENYCRQLVEGILNLLAQLHMWTGSTQPVMTPILCDTSIPVGFINASASGIFVPAILHWTHVNHGDVIGHILHPLKNTVEQEVLAPVSGIVFTLREYPLVNPGSLMARIYPCSSDAMPVPPSHETSKQGVRT